MTAATPGLPHTEGALPGVCGYCGRWYPMFAADAEICTERTRDAAGVDRTQEEPVNETATTTDTAPHLWEADHDYYCQEGNYFATPESECHTEYRTWGEFFEAEGDADMDYNLLFRWDWRAPETGVMGELTCFWVGQRKALLRSTNVLVHPDEEPLVRAFLQPRLDHLVKLWAPLTVT